MRKKKKKKSFKKRWSRKRGNRRAHVEVDDRALMSRADERNGSRSGTHDSRWVL